MIDVEIETWCNYRRKVVLILLMCEEKDAVGVLVKGKPTFCSESALCAPSPRLLRLGCLLDALSIETNRNKVVT